MTGDATRESHRKEKKKWLENKKFQEAFLSSNTFHLIKKINSSKQRFQIQKQIVVFF
jgi:hypothetical protein